MSNVVLKCENLGIVFGGLAAVNDFDIEVHEREIAGLIGPNGAGKTTVFNLLTKVYEPTSGEIFLNGESTAKKTTVQLSKAGIARTFQNIRLFNKLTVAENVMTAMNQSMKYSLLEAVLRLPRYWKERARCPTARSGVWRSSGLWRRNRASCCWTNRRRA